MNYKIKDWEILANKELKEEPEDLNWETDEGITVRPVYTKDDLKGLPQMEELPGLPPSLEVRVQLCMLVGHGQYGNMQGFQLRKRVMPFIKKIFEEDKKVYLWHLIWQLIEAMTVIIRE